MKQQLEKNQYLPLKERARRRELERANFIDLDPNSVTQFLKRVSFKLGIVVVIWTASLVGVPTLTGHGRWRTAIFFNLITRKPTVYRSGIRSQYTLAHNLRPFFSPTLFFFLTFTTMIKFEEKIKKNKWNKKLINYRNEN